MASTFSAVKPRAQAEALTEIFREGAIERDAHRTFPHEQCSALRESGLLGLLIPREFGGMGGSFADLMAVSSSLGQGDPNIAQMFQVHSGGVRLLLEIAPRSVQEEILTSVANEGKWLTNSYSERGTANVNVFTTTVTPDGENWRLNGTKFYCTGSLAGDWTFGPGMVAGGAEDEVRVFFVDIKSEGVTIHDDWDAMGQRTTASGTMVFDNVLIHGRHCLSPTAEVDSGGAGGALATLVYQAVHTGIFVGIAKEALHDIVSFVPTKARLWYESVADSANTDPYTLLRVGELRTQIDAAELLAMRSAELCDDVEVGYSDEKRGLASVTMGEARAFAAEVAMHAGTTLFKVTGTSAILSKYGHDRHWRNARALSLHNPLDFKYHHAGDYALNGKLPTIDSFN